MAHVAASCVVTGLYLSVSVLAAEHLPNVRYATDARPVRGRSAALFLWLILLMYMSNATISNVQYVTSIAYALELEPCLLRLLPIFRTRGVTTHLLTLCFRRVLKPPLACEVVSKTCRLTQGAEEDLQACPRDSTGSGYPSIFHDHHRGDARLIERSAHVLRLVSDVNLQAFIARPLTVGLIPSQRLLPAFPSCLCW